MMNEKTLSQTKIKNVNCRDCGRVLDEDPHENTENRQPCPDCGSIGREIQVELKGELTVYGMLNLKKRRGGIKRPLLEGRIGSEYYTKIKKLVRKERYIDRENDIYKETIKDTETNEIIHHKEEPLSKHQGHGSAKFKRKV